MTQNRVQYGKVIRQHYAGRRETLLESVTEKEANQFLSSPDAQHGTGGETFDYFLAEGWIPAAIRS